MLNRKNNYFLEKEMDIKAWLESQYILSYELVKNDMYGFVVDVQQSVNLTGLKTGVVPIKFREIRGDFICSGINLSHLEFAPERVSYKFDCSNNNLTSLRGAPTYVGKGIDVSRNMLTTLRFCPLEVRGKFDCSYNQISSLDGIPGEIDAFYGSNNTLTNLLYSPKSVQGDFIVSHNRLTTLDGCPDKIGGSFLVSFNDLFELDFFPDFVGGNISLQKNERLGDVQNYHEFRALHNEHEKIKIARDKNYMEQYLPLMNHNGEDSGRSKI